MTEFQIATVEDLINRGVLEKPLDGNHGGLHPKNSDYVDEGIPFIMASDIDRDRINFENCKYITREQASTLRKGFAKEGDVLLSHKATIGKTAVVENIPTDFIVLTPQVTYYRILDESILDRYYLHYYFKSPYFQSILNSWSGSGSTRAYISITEQRKLPILLPSIDVQKRITSILRSLDLKIELNLKMNKTLEEMAMTLYKHWFVDFEPFQDGEFVESELGMIPKGWRVISCYDLANYINGKAFKTNQLVDNDGLPVIKIAELKSGITNSTKFYNGDIESKYLLQNGDILFAWSASLGVFIWAKGEAVLNQHIFNVKPNGTLSKSMIYFTLKNIIQEFIEIAASRATTMGHITKQHLIDKKIALPPDKLLVKVDEKMSNCYQMILSNMLEVERLTQIRDYLLPRFLSGEIDVSKAEKQVEEVV